MTQFPNGNYAVEPYYWGATANYYGGLRTPPFYNANLSIARKFRITEGAHLELFGEATNLLNATMFYSNAINGSVSAVLAANPATSTKVGQNSNVNRGSLGLNLYEPRQITLSLQLRF